MPDVDDNRGDGLFNLKSLFILPAECNLPASSRVCGCDGKLTSFNMKAWSKIAVLFCVLAGMSLSSRAQMAVPPPMPAYQLLSGDQLDQLLGPIALYPDPLIAQILPAATLPTQIVLADRYLTDGGDPNLIDQQPWDASVQALARYPNVLQFLDQNLDWTAQVGQAFLNQQQDVMESIQRLRQSAMNFGNLQSTPQQQVVNDGGDIEIVPADPQVIYVPVYQPTQVYYQTCYGTPFISFGIGFAIGSWLNCDFDWHNHNIIVWNHDHPRPVNWWHEPAHQRDFGHTTVWHPENRPGAARVNRGDRGWGAPQQRQSVVATVSRSVSQPSAPHQTPPQVHPGAPIMRNTTPISQPARTPVEHAAPVNRPESNGAFIGIQSSHDTRNYSNRGQRSMQTVTHSAPPSAPAPTPRPAPTTSSGSGGHEPVLGEPPVRH
jgi:hypothetical protein